MKTKKEINKWKVITIIFAFILLGMISLSVYNQIQVSKQTLDFNGFKIPKQDLYQLGSVATTNPFNICSLNNQCIKVNVVPSE